MIKKIIVLTGNEMRHEFFRKYISSFPSVEVMISFCEVIESIEDELIQNKAEDYSLQESHLQMRSNVEIDFFRLFNETISDKSNPVFIRKGQINDAEWVNHIKKLNPDFIISYGCSIIKSELIEIFEGRFINVHLGLSPYYRGSATNFWPFVNNEISCVGVTFMFIDRGVDTGEIIHQQRASIIHGDNIHTIGCRLIQDMVKSVVLILENIDEFTKRNLAKNLNCKYRYYRKKDFCEQAVSQAYINIKNGIIEDYLKNKNIIDINYPIINLV